MSILEAKRAARRQADLASIKALATYLLDISRNPSAFLHIGDLKHTLRSQGRLAKLEVPEANIRGMSLNHQSKLADELPDLGGYTALNALRLSALEAITAQEVRASRGNTRSKEGLLARVRELEADNLLLKQDLALLQRAFDLRCIQARNYAEKAGEAILALCTKEQRELYASFSLRRKAVDETSNVVDIDKANRRAKP
jgi:hypothetical protein